MKVSVFSGLLKHHNCNNIDQQEIDSLCHRELPSGWKRVTSSNNAWVARLDGDEPIYFKLFLRRSLLEGIKSIFQGSRAKRFVRESNRLRSREFSAPKSLTWDKCLRVWITGKSWVLTRGLPGTGVFDYWCRVVAARPPEVRKGFLKILATEIGRLHNSGIVHGDLRLNNILVAETPGGNWQFSFLDNERNRAYGKRIRWRGRCRNLVQMNMAEDSAISNRDRKMFFVEYCGTTGLSETECKKLFRDVVRWTLKRKSKRKKR